VTSTHVPQDSTKVKGPRIERREVAVEGVRFALDRGEPEIAADRALAAAAGAEEVGACVEAARARTLAGSEPRRADSVISSRAIESLAVKASSPAFPLRTSSRLLESQPARAVNSGAEPVQSAIVRSLQVAP